MAACGAPPQAAPADPGRYSGSGIAAETATTSSVPTAFVGGDARQEDEELPDVMAAAEGYQRFQECKRVIDTVNLSVERMKKLPRMGMADALSAANELRDFGKAMTEEADRIAAIDVTLVDLRAFVGEYSAMIREVARAADDRADALVAIASLERARVVDKAKMAAAEAKELEAQQALQKATEKEDPLVDRINAFCGAT
jgi:hypothetical protein